jgi:hypothetical protein
MEKKQIKKNKLFLSRLRLYSFCYNKLSINSGHFKKFNGFKLIESINKPLQSIKMEQTLYMK